MSGEHYLHHDADTRALIAEAEVRGAVRALREAAERWPREMNIEVIRRELDTPLRQTPEPYTPADWLRDRADRIEAAR